MAKDNPSRYGLSQPSESEALLAIERVLGQEDAQRVWESARRAVGLAAREEPMTLEQLRRVADHLSSADGFVGVMGTSLRIRLETYEALANTNHKPSASGPRE